MYWLCGGICKIYRRTCRSRPSAAVCGGAGLLLLPREGGAAQIVLAVGAGGNFSFFNPVFYKYVGTRFLSGVYWRLLWMLPWTFVIAYAVVRMAYRLGKQALRIVVVAVACVCIFVTGKPVLSAETYGERSNVYELPQAAVEIADLVQSRLVDWQETLIVPNELLCSVRQYSAAACLLYGRNAEGFISNIGEEEQQVYEEMSSEHPDVARVTEIAKNKNCRYIVFNTSFHQIPEDLTEYGYEKIAVIEDVYAVYSRIGS